MNRDKAPRENKNSINIKQETTRSNTKAPDNINDIIKLCNDSSIKSNKLKKIYLKKALIKYLNDKYSDK